MIGAAMPAATEAPYRGSRLRPQEEALYRSNSSLELLAGQHHQQHQQHHQQQQEPRREYGSHGSLDVLSSSSDSFFAMLQDYRPAVLGPLCSDQRSPGPAEFLKGKVVCGDLSSISQSSVSRIIFKVAVLLAALIGDVIKFPSTVESQVENQHMFRDLGATDNAVGLPAIDGAIDCTHVRLTHTNFRQFQEVYRNRKGWFSLNVQAVVGPNMEFLDIVSEWSGSTHDSRIFQNSRLYVRYQERHLRGALVGDIGYPCLPFLFTPVAYPVRDAERRYNFVHARTRGIVERTFGVWKRRFPCLSRGIATKLVSSTTIVVACAVLHNISLIINDVLPEEDYVDEGDFDDMVEPFVNRPGEGLAVRQALIERLYM